jgi:hypothetical protein
MTKTRSIPCDPAVKPPRPNRRPALAAASPPAALAPPGPKAKPKAPTKGDLLIVLLQRDGGVTATQMAEATGWQLHSVRGFIAGTVKKKLGRTIATEKVDGQTVYRIVDEAAA